MNKLETVNKPNMNKEALKEAIGLLNSNWVLDDTGEWLNITVPAVEWPQLAATLKKQDDLYFDYLFCITAVDWKTHFTVVYHLSSVIHRHTVVVKVNTPRDAAEVPTVSNIWPTAEFHEREAYDLMGIVFTGHPDLRRLFLTDDWKGFPLRKDYEDPVN
ncbi:MAG: NADH-quinone oxidoreductase subunit C, partial [Chitinophagaceae bacterium]